MTKTNTNINTIWECPECGEPTTERVFVDWLSDAVSEVRVCNECGCEYVNRYSLFEQEVSRGDS